MNIFSKKAIFPLIVASAMFGPFGSAQAECKIVQELINKGQLDLTSIVQVGGNVGVQVLQINQALCEQFTQKVLNTGKIKLVSTAQVGGNFGIQVLVVGK